MKNDDTARMAAKIIVYSLAASVSLVMLTLAVRVGSFILGW